MLIFYPKDLLLRQYINTLIIRNPTNRADQVSIHSFFYNIFSRMPFKWKTFRDQWIKWKMENNRNKPDYAMSLFRHRRGRVADGEIYWILTICSASSFYAFTVKCTIKCYSFALLFFKCYFSNTSPVKFYIF